MKMKKINTITWLTAAIFLLGGVSAVEAQSVPCGTYDPIYGYGQCPQNGGSAPLPIPQQNNPYGNTGGVGNLPWGQGYTAPSFAPIPSYNPSSYQSNYGNNYGSSVGNSPFSGYGGYSPFDSYGYGGYGGSMPFEEYYEYDYDEYEYEDGDQYYDDCDYYNDCGGYGYYGTGGGYAPYGNYAPGYTTNRGANDVISWVNAIGSVMDLFGGFGGGYDGGYYDDYGYDDGYYDDYGYGNDDYYDDYIYDNGAFDDYIGGYW